MSTITRDIHHVYSYEGVTYPGVTGVLKIMDKSEVLKNWAAKQTAQCAIRSLEILPKMVEEGGEEAAAKFLANKSNWALDNARDLGTEVHEIADLINRGEPTPSISPDAMLRVEHYRTWLAASGWDVKISEAYLVNTDFKYGGTLDILARDKEGRAVLADIKTGKGVYKETILQLAAYGMASLIQPVGAEAVSKMPKVDRYVVIHVLADKSAKYPLGVREIEVPIGDEDRSAFLACMDLTRWSDSQKGRAL